MNNAGVQAAQTSDIKRREHVRSHTEPGPVSSNQGHNLGVPRDIEDFPQGPITSSAWEGWWHPYPHEESPLA